MTTFKGLPIGGRFNFEVEGGRETTRERGLLWSGMRGPWVKVSPRCYRRIMEDGQPGTVNYTVGTIGVRVTPAKEA